MTRTLRLVRVALAFGVVALLAAAVALISYAHTPDGTLCSGRVYRAAWQPDALVFSGERAPGEAARLRTECQAGALSTARNARDLAGVGLGLLVLAGTGHWLTGRGASAAGRA